MNPAAEHTGHLPLSGDRRALVIRPGSLASISSSNSRSALLRTPFTPSLPWAVIRWWPSSSASAPLPRQNVRLDPGRDPRRAMTMPPLASIWCLFRLTDHALATSPNCQRRRERQHVLHAFCRHDRRFHGRDVRPDVPQRLRNRSYHLQSDADMDGTCDGCGHAIIMLGFMWSM